MTLFIFKKKPIEVTLFTANESAFRFSRPQKASHFTPEWWKKLPKMSYNEGKEPNVQTLFPTMKTCTGFIDLYASGFIHPMWCDFGIEVEPDGSFLYQYSDKVSVAQDHSRQQMMGNHFLRSHTHLKLSSPWLAKEGTNTKFMVFAPAWNDFGAGDVCVPPGVTSYKVPLELNINMFFRRHAEKRLYEIAFGQPIAHFVPLSDRPLKLRYELVSEAEKGKIFRDGGMHLFFNNRNKQAAKLCPYA